eukprot:TRINITY_DN99699_c0_g1_i1.p1 TRINITY_DN99699_c0_g1~~TRINITY_DN99699_c0_g1_i1.p1  ORF type:complete len:165 (-),score=19.05 TRINITY_DN99699_c0_g1_i1:142-615(-)
MAEKVVTEGPECPKLQLHYIPCNIHFDGVAKVSTYFSPQPDAASPDLQRAAFRGRGLQGKAIALDPPGFVLQENMEADEESSVSWTVKGQFSEFVDWEWDKPAEKSTLRKCCETWPTIAAALAKQPTLKDVQSEMDELKAGTKQQEQAETEGIDKEE